MEENNQLSVNDLQVPVESQETDASATSFDPLQQELQSAAKKVNEHKGLIATLTTFGYAFIIIFLLMVCPIVCPMIFGYHTYLAVEDNSGLVSVSKKSLVYAKDIGTSNYVEGNLIAVSTNHNKDVIVYYVDENFVDSHTITTQSGQSVYYDQVQGRIAAKTPYMGYLCQVIFAGPIGIVCSIIILIVGIILTTIANKTKKKVREQLALS